MLNAPPYIYRYPHDSYQVFSPLHLSSFDLIWLLCFRTNHQIFVPSILNSLFIGSNKYSYYVFVRIIKYSYQVFSPISFFDRWFVPSIFTSPSFFVRINMAIKLSYESSNIRTKHFHLSLSSLDDSYQVVSPLPLSSFE